PLDLVLPGSERVRPLPLDPAVACGIPARPRSGAPSQVRTRATAVLLLVGVAGPYRAAAAQGVPPDVVAQRAESLRVAGRPWHAAETLLAVAAREPHLNATFVVEGAKAELHARRYDRARGLLVGQPWLDDYNNGEALGVLAEAEAKLGQAAAAALHYAAAREAGAARAQALLAAGDSTAALEALAQVGRSLDVARLALALGDSSRARDALYGLMARAPESDDGGAAVGVALASLRPRSPPERVALARAMKFHGAAADAKLEVERALRQGDSSASTLVLAGELFATTGRYREAERAYRAAARDPALGSLAIYRRARV